MHRMLCPLPALYGTVPLAGSGSRVQTLSDSRSLSPWFLRSALGVEHNVIFVICASPNADVTWPPFVPCDPPAFIIEQGGNVSGRDVVGWVAAVSLGFFDVNDGMVDRQEVPSSANRGQKGALGVRGWDL